MKAFVFKGSNDFIGKFNVGLGSELTAALQSFLANRRDVPAYSYVEMGGQRWTIISANPLQLADGEIKPGATAAVIANPAQAAQVSFVGSHCKGVLLKQPFQS